MSTSTAFPTREELQALSRTPERVNKAIKTFLAETTPKKLQKCASANQRKLQISIGIDIFSSEQLLEKVLAPHPEWPAVQERLDELKKHYNVSFKEHRNLEDEHRSVVTISFA